MAEELAIDARGIGVDASWGHIYGPVDLQVPKGGVTILVGQGGRGRTALLLTLAGRMRPSTGELSAFGRTNDAHHLFDNATIAVIDEVDRIEQAIRVSDVVTEQVRWAAKWHQFVRPGTTEHLRAMCAPVFGDVPMPPMDAFVEELPELTGALFRVAVANVKRPPLLVVGGIDNLPSIDAARTMLERLVALGEHQTVITPDVNGALHDLPVRAVVEVDNLTDDRLLELLPSDRI